MDVKFTPRVNNFKLINFQEFTKDRKKLSNVAWNTVYTVYYRCSKLWTLLLDTIKNASSLILFKSKIKL